MSAEQQRREPWIAPQPFRAGLEDLEQISCRLLAQIDGQVLVPVADVEFLARRLNRLASAALDALPSDVT